MQASLKDKKEIECILEEIKWLQKESERGRGRRSGGFLRNLKVQKMLKWEDKLKHLTLKIIIIKGKVCVNSACLVLY